MSAAATPYGTAAARAAADAIRARVARFEAPVAGIVLGSGLGGLAAEIEGATHVPFAEVPGFPATTVVGHAGALIVGRLAGRPVVCLAGRFHLYEGHPPALAGFPVRVLHALGAPVLVVSNAAGGLRRTFRPGDLMVIDDHVNMMFRNPLEGVVEEGDARFPDMSEPYDRELRARVHEIGRTHRIALVEGSYCGLLGPTYETLAEIRMLDRMGVDAVGMSTVPEVVVARALGMRVVGISCITNLAAGLGNAKLDHQEVIEMGREAGPKFQTIVRELVKGL